MHTRMRTQDQDPSGASELLHSVNPMAQDNCEAGEDDHRCLTGMFQKQHTMEGLGGMVACARMPECVLSEAHTCTELRAGAYICDVCDTNACTYAHTCAHALQYA